MITCLLNFPATDLVSLVLVWLSAGHFLLWFTDLRSSETCWDQTFPRIQKMLLYADDVVLVVGKERLVITNLSGNVSSVAKVLVFIYCLSNQMLYHHQSVSLLKVFKPQLTSYTDMINRNLSCVHNLQWLSLLSILQCCTPVTFQLIDGSMYTDLIFI